MAPRTDPHRPGAIIPTDYTRVLWYALAHEFEGWPQPAEGINCQLAQDRAGVARTEHRTDTEHPCCWLGLIQAGAKRFQHPDRGNGPGQCSVCGAWFIYGEVWRHEPTGEHIHVGHDCADKYGMLSDRSEWEAWHARQTALRSQAAKDKRFKMAALRFLEERPDLAAALAHADDPKPAGPADGRWSSASYQDRQTCYRLDTLRDLRSKLNQWGNLSDKQVGFALKLAAELTAPRVEVPAEVNVPAPTGRVKVRGKVVSVKSYDGDWGTSWKLTVKVPAPGGVWLCWATMPASIGDEYTRSNTPLGGLAGWLRGREVEFTATLETGREPHFAFGKRPTGGRVVEV